jgi:hypothetical protein
MKYVLMVAGDGAVEPSPAEIAAMPEMQAWLEEVERRGITEYGIRLRPPAEAVTVRVRNGQRLVTDGPFAETKDLIGGFSVVDCPDLDEALELARRHPSAQSGCVEVRPFAPEAPEEER